MADQNTQRLSVPVPSQGKPVLVTPPGSNSTGSLGIVITAIMFLLIGGTAGFFAHRHLENQKQYERYAAELEPLLYYKDRVHGARTRGSNEIMRIVNFKIYQAYQDGLDIPKLISMAQPAHKHPPVLTRLNLKRFLSNLELGIAYGIYEGEDNLKALAYGRAPTITKGEFKGQRIDVEHIVPKAIAPDLDNILANLMWLPASLNQSKSDTITDEAMQMAEIFVEQGILPRDQFLAVKRAYDSGG